MAQTTMAGRQRVALAALAALAALGGPKAAQAIPIYARQTGQACAACHTSFPELTPYGRQFKLNGYTFGGGQSKLPPLAMMMVGSFTNTQQNQQGGAAPHFGENNNFAYDFASVFYGGVLLPHLGMFGQLTYNNIDKSASWDNTDIRYAQAFKIGGYETVFGASLNNNPTVSDVWNSTPAWGYPWLVSGLAPGPAAHTLIEGGLAQQVVGFEPYVYWNRLLYIEAGGYRSLDGRMLDALGANPNPANPINGVAPYWRVALEPTWGPNSLEIGTFGLHAASVPGGIVGFGTDHVTDVGVDAQFEYLAGVNGVTAQADLITESDAFDASEALGLASHKNDHLRSFHAKASYYYDQTYAATLGYFDIHGSGDAALYGANSLSNSPNSNGFIGELDWIPFNHGGPAFWPWLNVKFGLQYTYYLRLNGGTNNYDGAGNNATGANTLYLFAWLAF